MMTQEEYMDVMALHRQGWNIKDIAEAVGRHPATVSGWIKNGGPPAKREVKAIDRVIDEHWTKSIDEILGANRNLLGTSVMRLLKPQGFEGSYPTLSRHLRQVRGVRSHATAQVSVPIETGPGQEFQFDWSDCKEWGEVWGLGELHCFGCILCWSRRRFWWFTHSLDRCHTLDGLVRFFEDIDGIPGLGRTDRMGALGHTRGNIFRFAPEVLEFARYHGCALKACKSRDAKRKGKVERPFWELKEAFFQELVVLGPPSSIDELNRRAALWLRDEIHPRVHRTTGVSPAERFEAEKQLLAPLPRARFDTARREPRQVGAPVPLVEVDGVPYSVPPRFVGAPVEIRMPVDSGVLEVRWRNELIAVHQVLLGASEAVWDPAHRKEAEGLALAPHARPKLEVVADVQVESQDLFDFGEGDFDVEVPQLDCYDMACGCGGAR